MGRKEKKQVFLAEFSKVAERSDASDFKRYVQRTAQTQLMKVIMRLDRITALCFVRSDQLTSLIST